nr:hypothetical protein [Endozoicomonas sp.]
MKKPTNNMQVKQPNHSGVGGAKASDDKEWRNMPDLTFTAIKFIHCLSMDILVGVLFLSFSWFPFQGSQQPNPPISPGLDECMPVGSRVGFLRKPTYIET